MDWQQKGIRYGPSKLMYKISGEIIKFIENTMENWRVELTAGGKTIAEMKIQRGIFQGDALSPLLNTIAMTPPSHILRKSTSGYKLYKSQEKPDVYGNWYRKMCHVKNESGKRQMAKEKELPKSRKNQNAWRKRNLQTLGNIRSGYHQTTDDKKKKLNTTGERENFLK